MKQNLLVVLMVLSAAATRGFGQTAANTAKTAEPFGSGATASPKVAVPAPRAAAPASHAAVPSDDLQTVLAQMNQAAQRFKNVQADFEWETYTAAVQEKEVQTGKSYFRRSGHDLEAMLDVKKPDPKQVLYKGGKVSIYEPNINRVTEREVSKNKSDVDAVMSLGFGGSGDELMKSYDVKWIGWETINGTRTAKMELTGKTPNLQKAFSRAVIWIDPERDIALQQQFFQSSGDYRLTRYHNIKYNEKMSGDVFKLQTRGNPEKIKIQ
jgi:outer membrane lipoprotein-sorting protein